MNGTPAMGALAARALLQAPDWRLPLLPAGDMYLEKVEDRTFERTSETGTESITATQYAISGLGFSPSYVWLDEAGLYFGSADGWFGVVREGWDAALPEMHAAQQERNAAWLGQLAEDLPERPTVAVAIQGARLFDPHTLSMTPGVTVVVEGNRIAAVGPDGEVSIPSEARVVDAEGKTLLPGLFDMHVHLSPIDGVLHMAAGVTTVRGPRSVRRADQGAGGHGSRDPGVDCPLRLTGLRADQDLQLDRDGAGTGHHGCRA
jgi:hypothetical protein